MRNLATIGAFLSDDKEIKTIIKVCDLLPTNDWRVWKSRFGSELKTDQDRQLHVSCGKVFVNPDLFANASIHDIAKTSKLFGYCNDKLLFWCDDDRLRAFEFNSQWRQMCPLNISLGIIRRFIEFENVEPDDIGFKRTYQWVFCWLPFDQPKYDALKELCKPNLAFLIQEC